MHLLGATTVAEREPNPAQTKERAEHAKDPGPFLASEIRSWDKLSLLRNARHVKVPEKLYRKNVQSAEAKDLNEIPSQ